MSRRVVLLLVPLIALAAPLARPAAAAPIAGLAQEPQFAFHPVTAGATVHGTHLLWANGSVTAVFETLEPSGRLGFRARTDACEGPARVEVRVDGRHVLTHDIAGRGSYAAIGDWAPGRHHVSFRYTNDLVSASCDRNLKIHDVHFVAHHHEGPATSVVQVADIDTVSVSPVTAGRRETRARWDRAGSTHLWAPGTARVRLDSQGATRLAATIERSTCGGPARVAIRVDGQVVHTTPGDMADRDEDRTLWISRRFPDGVHDIEVELLDARPASFGQGCEHGVWIDAVWFAGWV